MTHDSDASVGKDSESDVQDSSAPPVRVRRRGLVAAAFVGTFLGSVVGFFVGYFLRPRSGFKGRSVFDLAESLGLRELQERTTDLCDKLQSKLADSRKRSREAATYEEYAPGLGASTIHSEEVAAAD